MEVFECGQEGQKATRTGKGCRAGGDSGTADKLPPRRTTRKVGRPVVKRRRIPDHLREAFWDFCADVAEGRQRLWTDAEREYLREHYPAGVTKVIAQELGRTENAVITETCNLGIHKEWRRRGEQVRRKAVGN